MIENNYDENNYIQVNGNEYLMGIRIIKITKNEGID